MNAKPLEQIEAAHARGRRGLRAAEQHRLNNTRRPGLSDVRYSEQIAYDVDGKPYKTGALVREKDRRSVKERKRAKRLEREQKAAA
jgi:hypothetical protein